jgi:hypothetical protein
MLSEANDGLSSSMRAIADSQRASKMGGVVRSNYADVRASGPGMEGSHWERMAARDSAAASTTIPKINTKAFADNQIKLKDLQDALDQAKIKLSANQPKVVGEYAKDLGDSTINVPTGANVSAQWHRNAEKFNKRYGEFYDFMGQPGVLGKAKWIGKRAAVQTLKSLPVAGVVGGVSGGISSSLNKHVYDEQSSRSKGILGQLDTLRKQLETSKLSGGKPYSSLHDASTPGISYNPVIQPTTASKKKNKHVSFVAAADRYASADW